MYVPRYTTYTPHSLYLFQFLLSRFLNFMFIERKPVYLESWESVLEFKWKQGIFFRAWTTFKAMPYLRWRKLDSNTHISDSPSDTWHYLTYQFTINTSVHYWHFSSVLTHQFTINTSVHYWHMSSPLTHQFTINTSVHY